MMLPGPAAQLARTAAALSVELAAVVSVAVLVWAASVLYAVGIADNNGADRLPWLIIGLLGGPPGAAFTYLYFRFAGERHRRSRFGEGGRADLPVITQCPSCGESVPLSFECCQFCGEPLKRGRRR